MLWSAPELLRTGGAFCTNLVGDVYSFAIVLQEIITREKPYAMTKLTTTGIFKLSIVYLYVPTTFTCNLYFKTEDKKYSIVLCVFFLFYFYQSFPLNKKDIIRKLKNPPPLLRPSVSKGSVFPEIVETMKQCWAELPGHRPSFDMIYETLKKINHGK